MTAACKLMASAFVRPSRSMSSPSNCSSFPSASRGCDRLTSKLRARHESTTSSALSASSTLRYARSRLFTEGICPCKKVARWRSRLAFATAVVRLSKDRQALLIVLDGAPGRSQIDIAVAKTHERLAFATAVVRLSKDRQALLIVLDGAPGLSQ
eukprot:scaffold403_cov241-Pinguiococcus_pyrenoidosus.AAC.4